MCISTAEAFFGGTTILISETTINDKRIHVLGYQNTARNLAVGPNAMIIMIPTIESLTSKNLIDTTGCKKIFQNMMEAIRPVERSAKKIGLEMMGLSSQVEVFTSGIYTIATASDPRMIPAALHKIPENKRPAINLELFEFLGVARKGWQFALCCFDNKEEAKADPLVWWYEPTDEDNFILPGIDCHTGGIPSATELVQRDHWLIFGSDRFEAGMSSRVTYGRNIPDSVMQYLPKSVVGCKISNRGKNGDFIASVNAVRNGNYRTDILPILPFAA
jgi:hypothetical protein